MEQLIAPRSTRAELQARIYEAVQRLPSVHKAEVEADDVCAICLMPLESIFEEEEAEMIKVANQSSIAHQNDDSQDTILGVTKVEHCGHLFCRKDLTEWIRGFHGNCPTCRHPFLDIKAPSESDDESSDGGEYVPNDDEDNESIDFTDGFSDELEERVALESEFANEIYAEEERRALEEEFAGDFREMEEREEQRALEIELAGDFQEMEEREEQRTLEQEFAGEIAEQDALEEHLEEQRALEQEFAGEVAEQDAMEAQRALEEAFYGETYGMEVQEDSEHEYAAEAIMDVYFTDTSSDLDYEPQDYMMSDTDSEAMSSDLDYSVEELESLDQLGDPVTIHYDSGNDSTSEELEQDEKFAPSTSVLENPSPEA